MRRFGLIGFPLGHSFSKNFFIDKFNREGISDCSYENFPIKTISEFPNLFLEEKGLEGLNVTIPYKEQVLPFLNWKSEVVEKTGACNCIKVSGGKLYGFNTDTIGFEQSLQSCLLPHHNKALIFGTGGAAKAIDYVLEKLRIDHSFVTRSRSGMNSNNLTYDELSSEMLASHTLLINTTPLGMFPDVESAPPINYKLLNSTHCLFDLVYNPRKTLFLAKGELKGATVQNGFDMLVIQAEESWKIWNRDSLTGG
ncbi:MAG: shikimate dehydrogenase [Chitinophagaceae bacterium]